MSNPVFGRVVEGVFYQPRPGSYALVVDKGRIAVMRTPHGYFLPGGGAHPGEAPEEAVRREVNEECGWTIRQIVPIGRATEYVHAEGEGFFAKDCSFFTASVVKPVAEPESEEDHFLEWMDVSDAMRLLSHPSQVWAVSRLANGEASRPDDRR